MVITDRYDHLIDEKNRLSIPSQIRSAMDPHLDGNAFYLVPQGNYLQLIPEKLFERMAAFSRTGISPTSPIAKARRMLFANASRIEPDKQGRVIIPERFIEGSKTKDAFSKVKIGREVTLVGANDRVELWNRAEFVEQLNVTPEEALEISKVMEDLFAEAPPLPGPTMQPPVSGSN